MSGAERPRSRSPSRSVPPLASAPRPPATPPPQRHSRPDAGLGLQLVSLMASLEKAMERVEMAGCCVAAARRELDSSFSDVPLTHLGLSPEMTATVYSVGKAKSDLDEIHWLVMDERDRVRRRLAVLMNQTVWEPSSDAAPVPAPATR